LPLPRPHSCPARRSSDLGENRYLPDILARIETDAPGITLETVTLPIQQLIEAIDSAHIHFAFGYLPDLRGCSRQSLFDDHYVLRSEEHTSELQSRFDLVC